MHSITAVQRRFLKEFETVLKESTVRTLKTKYLAEVGLKKGAGEVNINTTARRET